MGGHKWNWRQDLRSYSPSKKPVERWCLRSGTDASDHVSMGETNAERLVHGILKLLGKMPRPSYHLWGLNQTAHTLFLAAPHPGSGSFSGQLLENIPEDWSSVTPDCWSKI